MSPKAREIAATHYAALASMTPVQRQAVARDRQASNMGAFTAETRSRRLERLFEIEAETGPNAA